MRTVVREMPEGSGGLGGNARNNGEIRLGLFPTLINIVEVKPYWFILFECSFECIIGNFNLI